MEMVKRLLQALVLCLIPGVSQAATVAISEPVAELVSSTDTTSYAMTAYTPTANSIQVVYVFASGTVAAGTMTGGSLTWIKAGSVASNGGVDTTYVFYARVGASPVSTAPTFDCTGDAATGVVLTAFQLTGVHWANPLRQLKTGAATAANPSVTMNIALKTGNGYTVGAQVPRNPAAYTQPASWTEIADTGHTTPTKGAEAAFRAGGETGTTVTLTGASGAYGMIVAEWNQGFDICGNMIDDDFTGGDLACPSPDGDNDGYTIDGSGPGDDFDCDDTSYFMPAMPYTKDGCTGNQVKKCNTATGSYGACGTPTEGSTNYYIHCDSGSDSNDCSFASPCLSFLKFSQYIDASPPAGYIDLAANRTVWFMGGTCTETYVDGATTRPALYTRRNGTAGNPIRLYGYLSSGLPATTIDVSATCDGSPDCPAVSIIGSDYLEIRGLKITGGDGGAAVDGVEGAGISSDGDNNSVIANWIYDNNGPSSANPCGINLADSPDGWTVSHNRINDNRDAAAGVAENERQICMFTGTGNTITRNYLYNSQPWDHANDAAGCFVWKHGEDGASNTISYNTLWNCNDSGFSTQNSGSHIHHNRVFDSERGVYLFWDFGGTYYVENDIVEYNTFVNAGFNEITPDSQATPLVNTVRYNVWTDDDTAYGTGDAVWVLHEFGTNAHFTTWRTGSLYSINNNCYYNSAGTTLSFCDYCAGESSGASYTFANWQGTAGFDTTSFVEDPVLDTYHRATSANCDEWGWAAGTGGGGGGGAMPLLLNAIEED